MRSNLLGHGWHLPIIKFRSLELSENDLLRQADSPIFCALSTTEKIPQKPRSDL
ncbi:unnamed protein product, partial [Vitis vinifera]|uniref:Uncharacterized protein n=1 Tax=Vitis vinifera TaxID=29760 RepID=D7TAK4_VITVI